MRALLTARGPLATAVLAVAFLAVALTTRLPFRDKTLFISDSVRYALALERYDMTAGRPHPPGNPLYVESVAALDRLLGGDPPLALAVLSAAMSGVALFFVYLLGRDLAGESAGWLAAGILTVSPLFWFFGAVGMPATGEAALSLVVAWLARRARAPMERAAFWTMTVALALTFGFRSTFAVLLLPLWIYASWRHPRTRIALGAALLFAAFFGWTAIVASLSGGWSVYRATSAAFLSDVVIATKILGGGWAKIPKQAGDIVVSAALGLGLFLVPCVIGIYRGCTGRWPFPGAMPFLAAWTIPTVAFHAAYDWAPRFGVPLLPPAAILAAATSIPLARRIFGRRHTGAAAEETGPLPRALVLFGLAFNLGLFLLPLRLGPIVLPEPFPSGSRLLARNEELRRRDEVIRTTFDPDSTLVLAHDHTFHVGYFLPAYRTVGLFPVFKRAADNWVPSFRNRTLDFEPGSSALPAEDPLRLPPEIRHIVLYDGDYLKVWPTDTLPLSALPYDVGGALEVATPTAQGCLDYDFEMIRFVPAGSEGCTVGDESDS
jgi:hypothetical protein